MNEDRRRKSSKSRSPPKSKPQSPEKKTRGGESSSKRVTSKSPKRKSTVASQESFVSAPPLGSAQTRESTAEVENLSGQGLTSLNPKLFQKLTLRKLILSANNLRSLPSNISDLANLEYLDLSKNPLRIKDVDDSNCLPLEMRYLKKLTYLSLRECNLRQIPTTVWLCQSITELDLSRNKLGLLVPDIGNLINLSSLNLVQCDLSTLPPELSFCSELVEIDLMGNRIESLPESLKELKKLHTLRMSFSAFSSLLDSYMEQLISKCQIKSEHIPVVIFDMESLLELDLKHTKINNLPENNFQALKHLYLDHNYFESLSESNLRLTKDTLTELTLSHNILKEIPEEVYYLTNLRLLDLSNNMIESLANRPLEMPYLEELHLSTNQLEKVDSSLRLLASLVELTLDSNQLTEIDESIYELKNLTYLDLSYNNLTTISKKLVQLSKLESAHLYDKFKKKGFWVIGNPLEVPPKEIWQTKNVEKISSFLSSYEQRNLKYVYYARLFFFPTQPKLLALVTSIFGSKFHPNFEVNNQLNSRLVRRFYKRTENKCEFSVIDISDVEAGLACLFLSQINFECEPTLICLVFDALNYSSEKHWNELGRLIEAVLVRTRGSIKLILIGLGKMGDYSKSTVLENSKETIQSYFDALENESNSIKSQLELATNSENEAYLKCAKSKLDELLKRQVHLEDDEIMMVENLERENLKRCLNFLEFKVIQLKKTAELQERSNLRDCLNQLPLSNTNQTSYESVLESLDHDLEKLNYAKTLNEFVWFQFDPKRNKDVYLHVDYMLNLINKFMRPDLKSHLSKTTRLEKSISAFDSKSDFNRSVQLFKKYGQCEQKLLKLIFFEQDEMGKKQAPLNESLTLLERFGLLYKSDCEYIENKCRSYFQAIFPMACSALYDTTNRKDTIPQWEECLYGDQFELYFIRLDQIRLYREECKELSALRKEKMLWASRDGPIDNEFYNYFECDLSAGYSKLADEDLDARTVEHDIYDSNGNLSFHDEQRLLDEFRVRARLELRSPFRVTRGFFSRFAIAVQPLLLDRFDWADALIGRDLNQTCVRVKFNSSENPRFVVDIKAKRLEDMKQMKRDLLNVFDDLECYYPGLFLFKHLHEEINKN